MPVSNAITHSMTWNQEFLEGLVPQAQVQEILSIPLSSTACIQDKLIWKYSNDGMFSAKTAFHQILTLRASIPLQEQNWKWVWRLRCAERIRLFIWLLLRNRVLTNAVRYERHMASSSSCPRCFGIPETTLHLLRDCPSAVQVWNTIGLGGLDFFHLPLQHWLECNARNISQVLHGNMSHDVLFLSTIWQLRKCRNRLIFKGEELSAAMLCSLINNYSLDTVKAMACNIFNKDRALRGISWQPPDSPFCKLNTDGSREQVSGLASARGVLGDTTGASIKGSSVNIGQASIFLAELWGCREGLILCKALKVSHLVIEMDSLAAVQVIEGTKDNDSLAAVLVADICRLSNDFTSIVIQHTPQEGNFAADFLAGIGRSLPVGTTIFYFPPPGLNAFLEGDHLGSERSFKILTLDDSPTAWLSVSATSPSSSPPDAGLESPPCKTPFWPDL
ncbi:hypothetical protein SLEP1_g36253 [Rubroshorea leprosula]|uniref:Uncharacterized protein n=1 Tax=Rubroshorea leprosula TaxID=152421 RepID=A0AAV5KQV6_9ROSI|nr:hypothetical protein SLEP1_g36253 [Rubroshorea leprosula]